jgi:hypothetical protein
MEHADRISVRLGRWQEKIPDGAPGTPTNALNNLIVNLGRNLADFLAVYDAANAMFFMYKTGELSARVLQTLFHCSTTSLKSA